MPVINNFADLKQVSKALKEEAKAREEAEKKRRAEEARRHAEANQFAAAMAEFGVRKMSQKKLADTKAPKPRPVALNLGTGEDKEPESQMSDLLDASVFLETEDGRMMHRKGRLARHSPASSIAANGRSRRRSTSTACASTRLAKRSPASSSRTT